MAFIWLRVFGSVSFGYTLFDMAAKYSNNKRNPLYLSYGSTI